MKDRIISVLTSRVTLIVALCILSAASFFAMSRQNTRTLESRIYNNGVKLLEEGMLNEALDEFIRVTETAPHDSDIDALAEYQIAWMLVNFGDGSFETLQNARSFWISSLVKNHPDKDTAVNLELIIPKMEEALTQEGVPEDQIGEKIDGNDELTPSDGEKEPGRGGGYENDY